MTASAMFEHTAQVFGNTDCDHCRLIAATLKEHGWTVTEESEDDMPGYVRKVVDDCQAGELPGILLGGAVVTTAKSVLMGTTDLRNAGAA